GSHEGLAGTAGEDHHTAAAVPESLDRLGLVGAQGPVVSQIDGVGFAVHITGEVLGGPAALDQYLLQVAAFAGMDDDGVLVDLLPSTPLVRLERITSVSTGWSSACRTRPCVGWVCSCSRP